MENRQKPRDKNRKRRRRRILAARLRAGLGLTMMLAAALWLSSPLWSRPAQGIAPSEAAVHSRTDQGSATQDWKLLLVNRWNPIPEDYEPVLVRLQDDQAVDERIYPDLQQMFDAARAEGLAPSISSSYRTEEEQKEILSDKIEEYRLLGHGKKEAERLAEEWVALPGTSEHQLGMAVDIVSEDRQAQQEVWEWLLENSWRYGFIRRYPPNKTDLTGVIHEPWHFRYVGLEAAKEIWEQGVCLEEYLAETTSPSS